MKKIYERPEIEALEVRAEDIITLSYMLPEIDIFNDEANTDLNGGNTAG